MTTTTNSQQSPEASQYDVVGTRPIRHDGVDKVIGAAKYGADIQLSGMLHGKVLRSPYAHARIRSIDTSKAEAISGVTAVVTSKDFPIISDSIIDLSETQGNARLMAEHVMAADKALYKGHAVAAVSATSPHIAELALEAIEIDYEVLKPVLSLEEAMKEDAPLLHDNLTTYFKLERFAKGDDTGAKSNIASHIQHKLGDVEEGFQEADVIVEREFTTQTVHQGYIEPHASTATWAGDGRLTIWTCTQGSFAIRSSCAAILDIPESQVRVIPTEIGGGFGAKITTYLEPVAAVLSKKSGRPVKVVMSRKDVFEGTGPTSASLMRTKIGATKDGKITAAQLWMAFEAGAYPGSPIGGGTLCATGPYNIANLLVDGYDVVCNKQKVQAYRAPGQPQGAFAVEPVIDELAEKLGIDPIEFRLMNVSKEGDRMPNGVPHPHFGIKEMEEAMRAHPHYKTSLTGPNQGRGVAVGYRWQGGQASSATITVNNDGTINLVTGSVDIGGSRTAVAMQAAEILGIKAEDVSPTVVDTDTIGWTGVTGGSRTAFDTGLAAIQASEEIIRLMKARAAITWEMKEEDVSFDHGTFLCAKTEDTISFKDLSARLMRTGGPVTCSVSAASPGSGPIIAGNLVDVEVDPETGKVDILRFTAFMDVGTAIHPAYVEGQIQGGTVQGIGWALNESYFYDDEGSMLNSSFLDYRMPTSLDVPMIETVMIEVPNPKHIFGVRGVGEAPIIPPLPALANAISDAIGVRMLDLPMTPDVILTALESKEA
ncbi:MAG: xanthine dehydrogenase family protein molybdopterin-binding subunit [Chloroflexota bacterium]|uniref:Aldehyde oxidase/xanthine dehydrogenase a/b hammerhead domain-containing protein n=1 Tax=marine metagenome TaxID=408172 RepID=A0A381NTY2_9ZZZZ|nr:xanthine dehydrogenase family protein molybdopterin-binding subunit [Dehalococcoidia bacterium]MEC9238160.1 xanthine dehydrogenase family protein molybdopterin-binding subunit [Chloroflexota bacterium]MEE3168207.1 xanthine dehydrogenase family protein molybdopterin-binding subunit [Chloroflexota bacterium]